MAFGVINIVSGGKRLKKKIKKIPEKVKKSECDEVLCMRGHD